MSLLTETVEVFRNSYSFSAPLFLAFRTLRLSPIDAAAIANTTAVVIRDGVCDILPVLIALVGTSLTAAVDVLYVVVVEVVTAAVCLLLTAAVLLAAALLAAALLAVAFDAALDEVSAVVALVSVVV